MADYKLSVRGEFEDKMSKGLNEANQSLGGLGDGIDKLKGKASGFGDFLKANLVSSAIKSSLDGIKNGIKATTDALVDMGKAAYNEGAKLQQSIGGVETMFKDSALQLQLYAGDAWRSGISKNDYMEQVTSFSAMLIDALKGDTEKAAEVANMAILDMADNANKFGTDMTMIQNAYQGLGRQQYNMLDNLKIGYGGTKEEMERLLADAEKLTGVHYDISNLADVFNAIHAIQVELGVTGTSAKEAGTTISGATGKLKAAWKNLLGNMTLGNGIVPDIENLKEAMGDWADNFIPSVESILDSLPVLADGIVDIADDLMEKFGTELVTRAGPLAEAGKKILGVVSDALIKAMPYVLDVGKTVVIEFGKTLLSNAPTLLSNVASLASKVPGELAKYGSMFLTWGQEAWDEFTNWLGTITWSDVFDTIGNVADGTSALLEQVRGWLDNITWDNIKADLHLEDIFTEDNTAKLFEAFGGVLVDVAKTSAKLATTFASVGLGLLQAIMGAIKDNKDVIGDSLADAISAVTTDIGNWIANNIDDILALAADSLILFFFDLAPKAVYGFVRGLGNINWGELLKNLWEGIKYSVRNGFDGLTDSVVFGLGKITGLSDDEIQKMQEVNWADFADHQVVSSSIQLAATISGIELDDEALYQSTLQAQGKIADLFGHLALDDVDLADNLKNKMLPDGTVWTDEFVDAVKKRIKEKSAELDEAGIVWTKEQTTEWTNSVMADVAKQQQSGGTFILDDTQQFGNLTARTSVDIIADVENVTLSEDAKRQMAMQGTGNLDGLLEYLYVYDSTLADQLDGRIEIDGIRLSDTYVDAFKANLSEREQELKDAGIKLTAEETDAMVHEVREQTSAELGSALTDALQDASDTASTFSWAGLGQAISEGIASGVDEGKPSIIGSLAGALTSGISYIKDFMGINSPSTLMRDEIGKWIPEGIAVGIDANTGSIRDAMSAIRNEVVDDAGMILGNTRADRYGVGGDSRTLNVGGVVNNIYGAQGQSEDDLADTVVDILIQRLRTEGAVIA